MFEKINDMTIEMMMIRSIKAIDHIDQSSTTYTLLSHENNDVFLEDNLQFALILDDANTIVNNATR